MFQTTNQNGMFFPPFSTADSASTAVISGRPVPAERQHGLLWLRVILRGLEVPCWKRRIRTRVFWVRQKPEKITVNPFIVFIVAKYCCFFLLGIRKMNTITSGTPNRVDGCFCGDPCVCVCISMLHTYGNGPECTGQLIRPQRFLYNKMPWWVKSLRSFTCKQNLWLIPNFLEFSSAVSSVKSIIMPRHTQHGRPRSRDLSRFSFFNAEQLDVPRWRPWTGCAGVAGCLGVPQHPAASHVIFFFGLWRSVSTAYEYCMDIVRI